MRRASRQTQDTPQLTLMDLAARRATTTQAASEPTPEATRKDSEPMKETMEAPAQKKTSRRATAESMAGKQREISISEFFTKNRHLLGFDNPSKALLTTIKEAVDNSLDACEEAGILPEIEVEILEAGGERYKVCIEDNGPGIVAAQVPKVFGKLLYGSKFHRLKQSRGQQGIGISAAVMYGQLTTGKPARVLSRTGPRAQAREFEIHIDTRSNNPAFTTTDIDWMRAPWPLPADADTTTLSAKKHGTRVEIEMTANWVNGQRSVLRYLEQTALANPHATIRYVRPKQPPLEFPRSTDELPVESMEIMPHPHGIELGMLMQRARDTKEKTLSSFLQSSFSRITERAAETICAEAKLRPRSRPSRLTQEQLEALHKALLEAKIPAPPTNCLSPIGDALMRKGLVSFLSVIETEGPESDQESIAAEAQMTFPTKKQQEASKARKQAESEPQQALPGLVDEEAPVDAPLEEGEEKIKGHRYFVATVTRPPKVYRGNPFQVEVGLAYGGSWRADSTIELYRMANRVPLLFQRGACAVTDAVVKTEWRKYELSQPRGSLPVGPMALLVHLSSVWVPFTSESKEAIAHYPEIISEVRLALQEVGRKLAAHLRKKKKADYEKKRRNLFALYIDEIATSMHRLTGQPRDVIKEQFTRMALEVTAGADFEKQLEEQEKAARAAKKPTAKKTDEAGEEEGEEDGA